MKNVLTAKEYRNLTKKPANILKEEKVEEEVQILEASPPTPSLITYYLMYPENEVGNYFNGVYKVQVDGKEICVPIVNGTSTTTDRRAKDSLVRAGFIFMYEKGD